MDEQECKECYGEGQWVGYGKAHFCPTCDGDGYINRTGPYRLANGSWSDGVDRSLELARRDTARNRWEVWQDAWGQWMAYRYDGKAADYEFAEFPTHAEAIEYADRMARTNQGETK